jgi:serine/threonine-protein kinase
MREARLAAGIHHANVVDVRDVEAVGGGLQLVMDYVEGASLGELVSARARTCERVPAGVAVRVVLDACAGLHAAHEARDDEGKPLGLVHRDVSPQNILVGVDGVARVTDFGIAKCAEASEQPTTQGILKGKAGYMAPEYVRGEPVDRRADVFALGVVLWEALAGRRLFRGENDGETLGLVLQASAPKLSETDPALAPLDAITGRAVARSRDDRFATAEELAQSLEKAASAGGLLATHSEVGRFVRSIVGERLEERRRAAREPQDVTESAVAEESTTVPRPPRAPSRRKSAVVGVGGALVLVGVSAIAYARWRTATVSPAAGDPAAPAASVATSAPSPPVLTPSSAASITAEPAAASAVLSPSSGSAAPRPRASPRTPPRSTGHAPPPNPYPAGN